MESKAIYLPFPLLLQLSLNYSTVNGLINIVHFGKKTRSRAEKEVAVIDDERQAQTARTQNRKQNLKIEIESSSWPFRCNRCLHAPPINTLFVEPPEKEIGA